MAFSAEFLNEIRDRVSLTDVIGRKVGLIRRGTEAEGLCPFHNEKTPSFTVSETKGFYHCFGCGAHGDVIGFVMNTEGLQFRDAVIKLAQEAGLQMPQENPKEAQRQDEEKRLMAAAALASTYFQEQLKSPAGASATAYLASRGIGSEAIRRHRMGFAPADGESLKSFLAKNNVVEELALACGLLSKRDDGTTFDFFRNRVIFPICNRRGQVVAFGGRTLGDSRAKYINSPDTPIFQKGHMFYGLETAQKAALETREIIVVEGYLDVVSMQAAGFGQTVAPLGTAVTEAQLSQLWKLAPEPVLCFDGDPAGHKAAWRLLQRALPLLKPGKSLNFAWLPTGHDPDSLVRQGGRETLRKILGNPEPLIDVLWKQKLEGKRLTSPERRSGFKQEIHELVSRIVDVDVRESYKQDIRTRFDILFQPARMTVSNAVFQSPETPVLQERDNFSAVQNLPYETILATLLNHPYLISESSEALANLAFPEGSLKAVQAALQDLAASSATVSTEQVREGLRARNLAKASESIIAHAYNSRFTHLDASRASAEEGLQHVIAILKHKLLKDELLTAAAALADDMNETNMERFEKAQRAVLEGETTRQDLDGGPTSRF